MTQSPDQPDDTSDRLYTPEELRAFAAAEDAGSDGPGATDPLAPPPASAAPPPVPAGPPASRPDPLSDPLGDSLPPRAAAPAAHPAPAPAPPAGPPLGVRPTAPPPMARPPMPTTPPTVSPTVPPAPPLTAPLTPAPPAAAPPTAAPTAAPVAGSSVPAEPRRFMTATDFLDRRNDIVEQGPANWGWRGRVRRWSGGLIKPKMGEAERSYEFDRSLIQRDFEGPKTIAFINPKGGAAKTTSVLVAGYTFGTVRGGGVIAWDNNETRGTLGIRGHRTGHSNTTRELIDNLGKFSDVSQSRIGDLGGFVRTQGDAHFDVLASDERPDVMGQIHADDFNSVHKLLERFYRIIMVDTGNNMRAENWLAAADAADLLVVTSTVREDTGYSGLWMLDALQDAGYQDLKQKTVTVLSDPSTTVDVKLASDLVDVYQQRTRAVFRVPYDPALVAGSVLPYNQLSENTRMCWLKACAGMASAL